MDKDRQKPSTMLLTVVVAVLMTPVLLVTIIAYSWRDQTARGVLSKTVDWPEPVQELEQKLQSQCGSNPVLETFLIDGRPGLTLSQVICRTDYREEVLKVLQTELELQPSGNSDYSSISNRLNSIGLVGEWWPPLNPAAQYFVYKPTHDGDEGPLFTVAIDRQWKKIFVHYWFNF